MGAMLSSLFQHSSNLQRRLRRRNPVRDLLAAGPAILSLRREYTPRELSEQSCPRVCRRDL